MGTLQSVSWPEILPSRSNEVCGAIEEDDSGLWSEPAPISAIPGIVPEYESSNEEGAYDKDDEEISPFPLDDEKESGDESA
jgi:hypothetical protein